MVTVTEGTTCDFIDPSPVPHGPARTSDPTGDPSTAEETSGPINSRSIMTVLDAAMERSKRQRYELDAYLSQLRRKKFYQPGPEESSLADTGGSPAAHERQQGTSEALVAFPADFDESVDMAVEAAQESRQDQTRQEEEDHAAVRTAVPSFLTKYFDKDTVKEIPIKRIEAAERTERKETQFGRNDEDKETHSSSLRTKIQEGLQEIHRLDRIIEEREAQTATSSEARGKERAESTYPTTLPARKSTVLRQPSRSPSVSSMSQTSSSAGLAHRNNRNHLRQRARSIEGVSKKEEARLSEGAQDDPRQESKESISSSDLSTPRSEGISAFLPDAEDSERLHHINRQLRDIVPESMWLERAIPARPSSAAHSELVSTASEETKKRGKRSRGIRVMRDTEMEYHKVLHSSLAAINDVDQRLMRLKTQPITPQKMAQADVARLTAQEARPPDHLLVARRALCALMDTQEEAEELCYECESDLRHVEDAVESAELHTREGEDHVSIGDRRRRRLYERLSEAQREVKRKQIIRDIT
ncbi:unnamed protein product [Vitrella brassicaformis CCMP3155]|uniref:Fibrous sheath-interacting protein 1 n=2 Tax=Vitrella brassicaformis TaxID=1169539 RepID=A0A0G4FXI8_VITBC|nr:unnamed protein product [Vitrella brassicaformis CCMP3155]|eukprot:CEM20026.1 unnamed protein product [Vitrella brassicaformis CCMP3155]